MFPDIFDYLQLHLRDGKFYRLGVQENTIGLLYQNVLDIFSFYDKAADSFLSYGKTGQLIIIRSDRLEHLAIGELDQREAHILRLHLRLTFQHLNRNEDLAAEQVHDHLFLQIP